LQAQKSVGYAYRVHGSTRISHLWSLSPAVPSLSGIGQPTVLPHKQFESTTTLMCLSPGLLHGGDSGWNLHGIGSSISSHPRSPRVHQLHVMRTTGHLRGSTAAG
jgi:hypothetical protein